MNASGTHGRVQIDSVAIIGFSNLELHGLGSCPGVVRDVSGTDLVCNGRGRCVPSGCECTGNWGGAACDVCKYGWMGEACDHKAVENVQTGRLCARIAFADLTQYTTTELFAQWKFADYSFLSSPAVLHHHFGTRIQTPLFSTSAGTHVRIRAGFLVADLTQHKNSGIQVFIAKTALQGNLRDRTQAEAKEAAERLVLVKHPEHQSGVNTIGLGKGDTYDAMDTLLKWPHDTFALSFKIWSPDIDSKDGGDHRFTLTHLLVESCSVVSQSATEDVDDILN